MAAILLTLIAALCVCIIFSRKLHETIPPAVFTVTLSVYLFALIFPLNYAIFITTGIAVILLILALILPRVCTNSFTQKTWSASGTAHKTESDTSAAANAFTKKTWSALLLGEVSHEPSNVTRGNERKRLFAGSIGSCALTLPFLIFLITSIVFCVLLTGRHVFYYDDLSYWALYTKNLFSIGHLPTLFENCSVSYKDYTPIMQILQYIAMFGRSAFSEDTMFRTNVCFIYVLLLPILSCVYDKSGATGKRNVAAKIAATVLYVIFPHVLTAQFYYRLGVDLFVALVFGYALYIIFTGEKDIFSFICLITSLSFLALVKTSGIVLCIFAIAIFVTDCISSKLSAKITVIRTAIIAAFTLGSYFSWQMFLKYSWNNGYLSDRVKSGITGGGLVLPGYTKEVVMNYIVHFFTYPLTRGHIGVTAAVLVLFVIIVRISAPSRKTLFVSSIVGLVLFCIAHLSMYLFIFDEWEAHGLLEFDRYITQYLGGLVLVYACVLLHATSDEDQKISKRSEVILYASIAVFVILLPYPDMKRYLLPSGYADMYETGYAQMAQNAKSEWESSGIDELKLSHDGSERLTVIADSWDETTQFLEYTAVPQPIDRILNVPAVEEGMIVSLADDYMEQYLYVAENAPAAYVGNWDETAALTADGKPLSGGTLYRVVRNDGDTVLETVSP